MSAARKKTLPSHPDRPIVPIGVGAPGELLPSAAALRALLAPDGAARVAPQQLRLALSLITSLGEVVSSAPSTGEPWNLELPEDTEDLARRSGVSVSDARTALDHLAQVGIIHRLPGRPAFLRLAEAVFERQPALAHVDWEGLREWLNGRATGVGLVPVLAVVRELARSSFERLADGLGPWTREPLARLVDATLFQRASVMAAIRLLERGGFVESQKPSGRTAAYRLLPPLFGEGRPKPLPEDARGVSEPSGEVSPSGLQTLERPSATRTPAADPTGFAFVARLNGSEIRMHPGARLEVPEGWEVVLVQGAGGPVLEIRPTAS